MAISKTILAANAPLVGIKGETAYGEGIDSAGADGTAYRQLPLLQATKPNFNTQRVDRLLSGRGSIENAADSYNTGKGGTVTMPFDFWATPKLLAQFMALVGQEHSETGAYIHQIEFDSASNAQAIGGTVTANLPSTVNLAYRTGTAAEAIRVTGAMVSDLTLTLDAGANNGLMSLSGNFFSGHANPLATGTALEETQNGTWTKPDWGTYYSIHDITTKQLEVEAGGLLDMVFKSLTLTITNNVVRVGQNSNGDAEGLHIPNFDITGTLVVKYDANFDYAAGTNILQDFLDYKTVSLSLLWGDGTVGTAGEMNITAEIQYTGDPSQDISETGIFHSLPFKCKQNASTEALKVILFNGESQTAW